MGGEQESNQNDEDRGQFSIGTRSTRSTTITGNGSFLLSSLADRQALEAPSGVKARPISVLAPEMVQFTVLLWIGLGAARCRPQWVYGTSSGQQQPSQRG